jgi:glycosyltransferase involved in cell wall biosynthesis
MSSPKVKVSIIVPVYNVSKYLHRCLDSLINQTLKDIEIILVNDASPDPQDHIICKDYEGKDNRIKYLIHKKNKNLGAARNTGINIAKGKYIGFVDSDDWVDLDMFEILYKKAEESNLDIINCGAIMEFQSGRESRILNANETTNEFVWDNLLKTFLKARAGQIDNKFPSGVWNKLYRKSFLDKYEIRFEEGYYFEELMFSINTFYHCNKMLLIPDNSYHWYIREGSISNTVSILHIDSIFYGYSYIKNFFISKDIYSKENQLLIDKLFYKQLFDIYIYNNEESIEPYIEDIIKKMNEKFDNYNFVENCILDKIKYKKLNSKVSNQRAEIEKISDDINNIKDRERKLNEEIKKCRMRYEVVANQNDSIKKSLKVVVEENRKLEKRVNVLQSGKWYLFGKTLRQYKVYNYLRKIFNSFKKSS